MFSRKNSLLEIYRKSNDVFDKSNDVPLGIGEGIVGQHTYYCLFSSGNGYFVPGIPMKDLHER